MRNIRTAHSVSVFFALLLLAMWWVSAQAYHIRGEQIVPGHPGAHSGDEPHYLLVINSLLFDGDLALHDDYARAYRGGLEAGATYRGETLSHHTILVDPVTREHAQWLEVFDWKRFRRCWPHPRCMDYARVGDRFPDLTDTVERSVHPIAYPAIVAAALAVGRPPIERVEGRVAIFNRRKYLRRLGL